MLESFCSILCVGAFSFRQAQLLRRGLPEENAGATAMLVYTYGKVLRTTVCEGWWCGDFQESPCQQRFFVFTRMSLNRTV
jgi:hypothetical protein